MGINNTIIIIIIIGVLLVLIGYIIVIYNQLISLRNEIHKNWSNIDILLKQRNSELIKLIDSCKEYMKYEQETFEKIINARNALNLASENKDFLSLNTAEIELRTSIKHLFMLSENYPALKTNESFINLQHRITELEESISNRREFYNESINLNNIILEQFPTNIIARHFGFKKFELLRFNTTELKDINIKENFNK